MKLLTKELEARFKSVGLQESNKDPVVVAKFFNPSGGQTWLATEYDPEEKKFFGYCSLFNTPHENEWGFFSLEELQSVRGRLGLGIERDLYWSETTFQLAKHKAGVL